MAKHPGEPTIPQLEPATKKLKTKSEADQASNPDVSPFMELPGELRNKIYQYSINWNDAVTKLEEMYWKEPILNSAIVSDWKPPPVEPPKVSTPTILLLCKQTTYEALGILHKTPFTITLQAMQVTSSWKQWGSSTGHTGLNFRANVQKIVIEMPNGNTLSGIPYTNYGYDSLFWKSGLCSFFAPSSEVIRSYELPKLQHLHLRIQGGETYKLKPTAAKLAIIVEFYWRTTQYCFMVESSGKAYADFFASLDRED